MRVPLVGPQPRHRKFLQEPFLYWAPPEQQAWAERLVPALQEVEKTVDGPGQVLLQDRPQKSNQPPTRPIGLPSPCEWTGP